MACCSPVYEENIEGVRRQRLQRSKLNNQTSFTYGSVGQSKNKENMNININSAGMHTAQVNMKLPKSIQRTRNINSNFQASNTSSLQNNSYLTNGKNNVSRIGEDQNINQVNQPIANNYQTQVNYESQQAQEIRDQDAYRDLMIQRLNCVGLTEDEFEDFIRRDTKDLFNNVSSEKLQALATVIDKKDFIDNYGLTED